MNVRIVSHFRKVLAGSAFFLALTCQVSFAQVINLDGNAPDFSDYNFGAGGATTIDGLNETIWDGALPNGDITGNIENVRTAAGSLGGSDGQGVLTGHLHYNNDNAVSARAAVLGASGFHNGNFSMLWTTDFTPDVSGDWIFKNNRVDDRYSFWIDLSKNGVFESNERFYVRTGCCGGSGERAISGASSAVDSLTAGDTYLLGLTMNDTGGGGYFRDMEFKRPGGSLIDLNPSANPGLFTVQSVPPSSITDLNIFGGGRTITSDAAVPSINVSNLSMTWQGSEPVLNVTPGSTGVPVEFTNSVSLSAATNTINANNGAKVILNNVSGAGMLLGVFGDGIVDLQTANGYSGIINVGGNATLSIEDRNADNGNNANNALSGNGVNVNSNGSLRLVDGPSVGDYHIRDNISISGSGNSKSGGALHNYSGNNEIEGLISLAGNAEIRNSNNRLRIDGGLALGGRDLTMRVNGGQVEVRSPITGTGGIIKSGDRIMYAMPNGNPVHTFSGAVLIQDGEYEIRNLSGLGTSGGGTTVQNGAALLLRVAGTINENNININGNGHGNNGAIRSLDHNIDLTGTVTFDGNSRIRVDQDTLTLSGNVNMNNRNLSITGNGNLNITGQVFSGGQIDKFDNGTTTLAHASNSISGPININAGTVRVNSLGALGGASAVDVSAAGTFDVNGGGDFSAAPITLKGGTLSATGGNHTVALSAPGGGTILNTTGGTTLTVASPISLGIAGGLNFDGAGNIMVSQGFGNGSAGVSTPNALAHFGYHTGPNGVLDLNANGGMMGGGNPVNGPTFHGLALLTNGPGNRGLDFNNDGDFTATGAIGQNDQYSNLWLGTFTAPQTGNYGFRNAGDDDRGGIWFDNNQNGIFESNGNLNSGQNDQLSWEDGGWKTVALTAGQEYLIGFTHAEGGGGSRADFRFRGPGVSGEPIVKPGAASQAGLWKGFEITPDNNVVKSGSGTTTFAGNNSYNGTTTIEEGMLVAAHNNALGTFDGTAATGTSIAAGGTLGVQGNITIGNEHLTMAGGGSTIRNLSGNNAILTLNTVVTGEGATNIIADAGTLSIGGSGSMDLGVSQLVVDGAGFTTISQEISAAPIGSSVTTFTPGIQETIWDAANTGLISTDNVRNNIEPIRTAAAGPLGANDAQGILTGHLHYNGDGNVSARAAELGAVGFNNGDFTMLWTTEFTPDEAGNWGFRNNKVDDRYSFWIDLNDDGTFQADERFYKRDNCCGGSGDKYISDASSGIDSLVAGENYLLGLVMNDTGGGGYFRDMEFKAPSGGWTNLDPSANGNMFGLTNTVSAPAIDHLVKNGPGGLRLDGLLHFNGGVDATGGTLIVNADNIAGGAAQGDWNIASGVTLGGHGSINADVNIAATPGIVSPGDQAFANIGTTWSGDPTYSAGTTLETVGTLTFAELNLGGILQLDVLADGADQIAGEIYLGPLSQLRLGLDGTSYDPSSAEFAAIDFEALGFEEDDLFELVTGDVDGMFGNMVDFEPFIDASGALMVDFIGGAGSPYSLQFSAAVVPEPGAILIWSMMGMGLCGYGYRRRRNRLAIQSK